MNCTLLRPLCIIGSSKAPMNLASAIQISSIPCKRISAPSGGPKRPSGVYDRSLDGAAWCQYAPILVNMETIIFELANLRSNYVRKAPDTVYV